MTTKCEPIIYLTMLYILYIIEFFKKYLWKGYYYINSTFFIIKATIINRWHKFIKILRAKSGDVQCPIRRDLAQFSPARIFSFRF